MLGFYDLKERKKLIMTKPVISVIIPVYNVENYLERCLQSVLKQTYSNLEILLIDDGSTDHSGEICDLYLKKDKRIKVYHKKNGGLSSARNLGLLLCKGDYVGFVDSDDWIDHEMYERLFKLIQKGDYDISVCGISRAVSEQECIKQPTHITEKIISGQDFQKKILKVGTQESDQYAVNKLYKKSVANSIKYPEGLTDEDVEGTFLAMLSASSVIVTNWIGYFYYINPKSITRQKFSQKNFDFFVICDHLIELSVASCSKEIQQYAKIFRKRADFSVLCRMALWADLSDTDLLERKQDILKSLRKNYFDLFRSDLPFSRKIIMTAFCVNFKWVSIIMRYIYRNSCRIQRKH